jgi:monoamine oxidase
MLGVAWGYETSLNTAITEILREEHETVAGDYHEIIGGMDRLPEAFAERLKTTPRLGCEVVRIEQDAKTASAIYRDRKTRAYSKESADAVVCAVPLGVLSHIETVPELSGGKRRALRQITYDSATKVLVSSDTPTFLGAGGRHLRRGHLHGSAHWDELLLLG